jgi:hypothetical protein
MRSKIIVPDKIPVSVVAGKIVRHLSISAVSPIAGLSIAKMSLAA